MIYENELSNNTEQAQQLLLLLFPNLKVPVEQIFSLIQVIEKSGIDLDNTTIDEIMETVLFIRDTKINPIILQKVARGVHNILSGTGQGQIIIHINTESTSVQIRETDKPIETTV